MSSSPISRRDFVNGVLAGSGAALLSAPAPALAQALAQNRYAPSGSAWTGYGGVGDYRWSNGNTEAVMNAAHGIRDGRYPHTSSTSVDETYDLVVIGGGFTGLTALYEFSKHRKSGQTALLLENHPVIGGEAKQNEIDVDGQRLVAPQGSNASLVINRSYVKGSVGAGRYDTFAEYWLELGMPERFDLEPLAGGAEKYKLPNDHYSPMVMALESRFPVGYYFRGHGWVRNPIAAHFGATPWPPAVQRELDDFAYNRRDVISGIAEPDRWLDSITYDDLLNRLGYGPEVRKFIDPYLGVANFGVCANAISGYAARRLTLPGSIRSDEKSRFNDEDTVSFPGGNAVILKKMLKRILPDSIAGDDSWQSVAQGRFDFRAFDRPGHPVRIRLGATAVDVRHEGRGAAADISSGVLVTYAHNGRLRTVRAKSVVVGVGGWVARRIVSDLPPAHAEAYGQFRYGPILTANVAVRHWRFFDKLGFTVARWFEGLGWHLSVRRNVAMGNNSKPLTPDSPVVLTFYIPFLHPGADPAVQGTLGRAQLLEATYAEFERRLIGQLTEMFGSAGFDARRDVAGVILNRWGHAYFAPAPGFFFGQSGNPPPHEVIRKPHGRIVFAHSELQGNMNMAHAMLEGRRAAVQAMQALGVSI